MSSVADPLAVNLRAAGVWLEGFGSCNGLAAGAYAALARYRRNSSGPPSRCINRTPAYRRTRYPPIRPSPPPGRRAVIWPGAHEPENGFGKHHHTRNSGFAKPCLPPANVRTSPSYTVLKIMLSVGRLYCHEVGFFNSRVSEATCQVSTDSLPHMLNFVPYKTPIISTNMPYEATIQRTGTDGRAKLSVAVTYCLQ